MRWFDSTLSEHLLRQQTHKHDALEGEMKLNLWGRYSGGNWEHIDSVERAGDKATILAEYKMAFGPGWVFEWRRMGGE